jgi:hypothetical protein
MYSLGFEINYLIENYMQTVAYIQDPNNTKE